MPAKILVVGDLIVDEFQYGSCSRISPEAPVPVVNVHHTLISPGGAANVARNVHVLLEDDESVHLFGVVGLNKNIPAAGIIQHCVQDRSRVTTTKRRIIANRQQQIVRIDDENTHDISHEVQDELITAIRNELSTAKIVIVSDYNKGVITKSLMEWLIDRCKFHGITLLCDPKKPLDFYAGADVVTPNENELIGTHPISYVETTGTKVLLTKGSRGMTFYLSPDHIREIPARAREVADVTGAGDTVIAALAVGLLEHNQNTASSYARAAEFANAAAAIAVSRPGTAAPLYSEIMDELQRSSDQD